jgi:hypothetical protein
MIRLEKGETLETICKARIIAGYEFEFQRRLDLELYLVKENPHHKYFERYTPEYMNKLKATAWERLP